jgi:hypothetical protein
VGSAVIEFLSLKCWAVVSLMRVAGSLQWSPPSVDFATNMAEVSRSAFADRLMK